MSKRSYIYDFQGEGQTIVLLHGFLGSSKYWSRLQPLLSRAGYRIITIDLLGFGNAPKPTTSDYGYADHIEHIRKAIKSLNIANFILAGHSMGALIASRYALTYPKNITSLFLLHPPIYKNREEARAILRSTGRHYQFFLDSKFREIGWFIMRNLPFTKIHQHTRTSREKSLKNIIEMAEIPYDLYKHTLPTILLIGLKDRHQYTKNIKNMVLNKSVKIVLKEVGHHSPFYEPTLVYSILKSASD